MIQEFATNTIQTCDVAIVMGGGDKTLRACRLFEQTTSPDHHRRYQLPMAATQTVPQHPQHCNFVPILPRHGDMTLFGYGINVHVDRGHLTIQDGIGANRREARLPRVGHGLRRLVVIGSDGMVSLAALRWLADQDAAFVMLDRDQSWSPQAPSDHLTPDFDEHNRSPRNLELP